MCVCVVQMFRELKTQDCFFKEKNIDRKWLRDVWNILWDAENTRWTDRARFLEFWGSALDTPKYTDIGRENTLLILIQILSQTYNKSNIWNKPTQFLSEFLGWEFIVIYICRLISPSLLLSQRFSHRVLHPSSGSCCSSG